jgi:RecJ-like exonuclease
MEEFLQHIKEVSKRFFSIESKKPILIYTHYDADGLSSAAILLKTLKALDKPFILKVLRNLSEEEIRKIKEQKEKFASIIFLDLGSNFLDELKEIDNIFIIDHHKIKGEKIPGLINYRTFSENLKVSSSIETYYFCSFGTEKKMDELKKIALIGLLGDYSFDNLSKLTNLFLNEAKNEIKLKKGLKVFSYTRPIHKALEFSNIYLPGITGKREKILEFLKEIGIKIKENDRYRTINDLSEEEISKLITSIAISRTMENKNIEIIGNIYLVKLFNVLEDAREIVALINACGRLNKPHLGILFLLEKEGIKKTAEKIYFKYKHEIIKGLKIFEEEMKNNDKDYLIVNCKDKINPNIVGTICSMIINSLEKDFTLVGLAYRESDIKFSIRSKKRDVVKILEKVKKNMDFDYGGHERAGGGTIKFSQEEGFLQFLNKALEEEHITMRV